MRIGARCAPPFGREACYPKNTWLYVMDSTACDTEYASMLNAQHSTLQELSALNVELHQDCSSITEKVRANPLLTVHSSNSLKRVPGAFPANALHLLSGGQHT